ncbi:MAG: hypothetical protein QOH49_59 [Acidobacteriota bacterium]|jgi:hypothetical protein|nr:hypothetical protein [Acidobacteriota bacterium]
MSTKQTLTGFAFLAGYVLMVGVALISLEES